MLKREQILSSFKISKFPKELFDEYTINFKDMLFYEESKEPISKQEKDVKTLSQSYVLPWRLVQKNNFVASSNNNYSKGTFNRGANFTPKEPLVEIKVDNFKLLYDKYSIPIETSIIYLKNNYGNVNGPYNLEQIKNMYKNKKFDSSNEFRTIDIYGFKDSELFSFQSLKFINDEKWTEQIIDHPLLQYTELFKNTQNILDVARKRKNELDETNKKMKDIQLQDKKKEEELQQLRLEKEKDKIEATYNNNNKEETNDRENKYKNENEKKSEKKDKENQEEDKEEIKNEIAIEIQNKILDTGGKWEIAGKKKKKVNKNEEDANKIIGLPVKKDEVKISSESLVKPKEKKEFNGEQLVDMLRPKKKEGSKIVEKEENTEDTKEYKKEESEVPTNEFKVVGKKGKKKKKKFEEENVSLGFKY